MRRDVLAISLVLGFSPHALALEPTPVAERWLVRVARMEGASVNVEEAAGSLHQTASQIAASGRLSGLSALAADAAQLERRVISASLAANVLDDLD